MLAADRDAHRLPDQLSASISSSSTNSAICRCRSAAGRAVAARAKLSSNAAPLPTDQQVSRAPMAALGDRRASPWLFVGNAESRQLDRLSRNTTDLPVIAREMQRAGAGIRSIAEPSLIPLRISPRSFLRPWRCSEARTRPHSGAHGTRLADAKARASIRTQAETHHLSAARSAEAAYGREDTAQHRPHLHVSQATISRLSTDDVPAALNLGSGATKKTRSLTSIREG